MCSEQVSNPGEELFALANFSIFQYPYFSTSLIHQFTNSPILYSSNRLFLNFPISQYFDFLIF
ncbi:uncharacterized protein ASCRUDRAFT_78364 [Ascoidea rubescens DSM 1968]|uniref:Uncharacterized protein n=1 Tax=Ascoidea rubescens DSM 1968 TaxID=1344418 RepID=A0A1D2V861_9ASCO|nr:hypothetical protein ASCRUDRAFT_78363 [Ascoidea rubescens DSM 1968]XP_020044131.1 hypothetical protein ASCRUDRAFT_78364 [Ascoidea rubescens DSM 1968]ODV57823.1 hypothetical protein ASCRUDRAFT_78363 [Ascoidea rubescens DSM 1968]ODV57824.1 hypothetical protein ASCRUDRAFT_78364 [Ascoidea rubescens DSM 1968]